MTPIATDQELIEACRAGQLGAFAQLVERYQNLVCAVAFSATGDRGLSEDVGQETFVAAWKALPSLEDPTKLRGWLCQTARNVSKMALRKRRREVPVDDAALERASDEASALDGVVTREQAALVQRALAEIPETYREPLVLFYREDQSIKQVADGLGLTEDAVKQRLSRGRQSLKQEIVEVFEHALTSTRPRKAFAVGVLAIIGAQLGTSTAMAANGARAPKGSGGWSGWKLGLVGLVAGAVMIGAIVAAMSLRSRKPARDGAAVAPPTEKAQRPPLRQGPRGAPPVGAAALPAATIEELDRSLDPKHPQVIVEVLDVLGGPIAGAEVLEADKLVGQTDERGVLVLARAPAQVSDIQTFRVRASGYAGEQLTYSGFGRMTIRLVPESTISGTVIDARTRSPVPNVRVFARDLEPVTTDAAGAFVFDRMRPGRYGLRATGPGLASTRETQVDVGLHYNETGVALEVERGYTIEGRVIVPRGALPANLEIAGGPLDVPVGPDGRFRIDGVAPGTYKLATTTSLSERTSVTVVDRDVQVELSLAATHTLDVVATGADGAPAAGVEINGEQGGLDDLRGLRSGRCTTDASGRCRITGLWPGTVHSLRPKVPGVAAREVVVPSSEVVRFELPPLGGIAGVVVDAAGRPLPWRIITATIAGGERPIGPVISDATGRFLFAALPPGAYSVDVYGYDNRSFMAYLTDRTKQPIGHAALDLAGGALVTDVRIATTFVESSLTGTVTTDDGKPVAGALVSLAIESPRVHRTQPGSGLATSVTDERGAFTFAHLDGTKTYDVWGQGPNGEQGRRRQLPLDGAPLSLAIRAAAELRITVTGAANNALVDVVIENADGERDTANLLPVTGPRIPDANVARFVGLRAGTWKITVTQRDTTKTSSVVVPEAGQARVSVELPSS